MRNLNKKGKWRNIVQSKPVLVLLGVVVLIFAWNVLSFWNKMEDTKNNKKLVEEKVATLRQQKENYLSEINNLKTDKGKEKFFRENLGLAKEGEDMIIVVEDKNQNQNSYTSSGGFFSFFKDLFK